MRKTLLFFIITLFTTPLAFSQTDTVVQHKIKFEHYAGVQMNELIRQVFNFNNSTTNNNTNPYLQTTNYISERGMMGGYTYPRFFSRKNSHKKRRKTKYGGSTFPLLNNARLGAEVAVSNIHNMINTSTGNPSQVSALPYMNQFNT
jgi:hypothetical protein